MLDLLPEEILVGIFRILDGYTLLSTSLVNRKLQCILTKEKTIREVCSMWNLPYFVNNPKFVSLYYDSYFHTTRTPEHLYFACLARSITHRRLDEEHHTLYKKKKEVYDATRYTKEPSIDETLLLRILKRELGVIDDLHILTRSSPSSTSAQCQVQAGCWDMYLDSVYMKYVHKEGKSDKSVLYGSTEDYISVGFFRFSWTMSAEKMAVLLSASRCIDRPYAELVEYDNIESLKVLLTYLRPRLLVKVYRARLCIYFSVAVRSCALQCFVYILEEMKRLGILYEKLLVRMEHTTLVEFLLTML